MDTMERNAGATFPFRLGLFFGALFLVMGTQLPFLPLWLDARGMSAAQISIISSAPLFIRVIATPALTFLADRMGDHRRVLIALTWAGTASYVVLAYANGFVWLFVLVMLSAIFWTSVMPLTETIAMTGVKFRGYDYGRMRLWGSLSFILASFAGGLAVQRLNADAIIWILVGASIITVISAHFLPLPIGQGRLKAAVGTPKLDLSDTAGLIYSRQFLLFLLSAGLAQGSHGVFYVFGSIHWRAQGISSGWIGMLWATGIITEILLFAFSGAVTKRFGAVQLLFLGGIAGILRWSAMAFDPSLTVLIPLQVLHGLTYGASHLGAIAFIAQAVPDRQAATAQGLYASITAGLAMGLSFLLAGSMYQALGGGAYWAMGALSLAGVAIAGILHRTWNGGVITV